ncbi:hypothetical protein [Dictyobacter formicarum]|uniref:Uncharacterized protein n=1 Tax=Dictyobacter formicarum TaxID=2778368 RepID=A0ABQ3VQG0_9CHLR|nr:hypothetical protein [Dictyobacter formicarum]GHO88220.1 hypothetical protein KSZ_62260 [Dictyobacter formicarum]
MTKSITHANLQIKHAGLAVECGALEILLSTVMLQSVLLMPISRTVYTGKNVVRQWGVHVTAKSSATSPVYYATFRAAEVVQTPAGRTLTAPYPYPQTRGNDLLQQAEMLQASLVSCVTCLLTQTPRVSTVYAPARYRLPDEWVWSADCQEARLQCRPGGVWTLTAQEESHD